MSLSSNALILKFFPSLSKNSTLKTLLLVFSGTLLLTLSAKVQIPIMPVRISLQSFVVMLLGALYGPRLAFATVSLYILQGAIGLPVFQGTPHHGIGLAYMVGPTGGYLLGFLVSTYVVGLLSERNMGRTVASAAILFIIGSVIVDCFGLAWLSYLMGPQVAKTTYISYQVAFFLKLGLFSALVPLMWSKTVQQ